MSIPGDNIRWEMIEAVRGTHLAPERLRQVCPDLYSSRALRTLTPNEIGCYLSHLKALEVFLASKHSHALILEDDAVLTARGLHIARRILADHPAVDVLKLGGFGPWTSRRRLIARVEGVDLVHCLTFGVCAHAYAVSRRGAERVLAGALPVREPYDTYLRNKDRFRCRIYETSPWLVGLQQTYQNSTIGDRPHERPTLLRAIRGGLSRARYVCLTRLMNTLEFGPTALFAPGRLSRFPTGQALTAGPMPSPAPPPAGEAAGC